VTWTCKSCHSRRRICGNGRESSTSNKKPRFGGAFFSRAIRAHEPLELSPAIDIRGAVKLARTFIVLL
jgi:hypothetical protein